MLLTTVGFAIVYTRGAETLTSSSLIYGALFLGLFAVVHLARRFLVPRTDPYLLPITALLSTLGILMIYRLNAPLALQQSLWLVVGLGVFVTTLVVFRRFRI